MISHCLRNHSHNTVSRDSSMSNTQADVSSIEPIYPLYLYIQNAIPQTGLTNLTRDALRSCVGSRILLGGQAKCCTHKNKRKGSRKLIESIKNTMSYQNGKDNKAGFFDEDVEMQNSRQSDIPFLDRKGKMIPRRRDPNKLFDSSAPAAPFPCSRTSPEQGVAEHVKAPPPRDVDYTIDPYKQYEGEEFQSSSLGPETDARSGQGDIARVGAFREGYGSDDEEEGTIGGNTAYTLDGAHTQADEKTVHEAELVDKEREARDIIEGARLAFQDEILRNAPVAEAVVDDHKGFWSKRSILCVTVLVALVVAGSVGIVLGVTRSQQAATPVPSVTTLSPTISSPSSFPPTLSPTMPPTPLETESLFTTNNFTHRYYGHMFDITAKNTLDVIALEIHMSSTDPEQIEVWTKEGEYHGYETDKFRWAKIGKATVTGNGQNSLTSLPRDLFDPVRVNAGEKRAFYVTVQTESIYFQERFNATGNVSLIDYGEPTEFGDENLQINVGTGVQYLFQDHGRPNIFNGAIDYAAV